MMSLLTVVTMETCPQTPSDWLIRYSTGRLRAGKGCRGDDDDDEDEEEGDEDAEDGEWWCWRPRSEVWLPW